MSSNTSKPAIAYILLFLLGTFLILGFAGCSKSSDSSTDTAQPATAKADPTDIPLTTPELIEGKEIWMGTCRNCHLIGVGGAPIIGNRDLWGPRIAKGEAILFEHAINGFIAKDGSMMPARGGNKSLTDEQVKKAVKFMITASQ